MPLSGLSVEMIHYLCPSIAFSKILEVWASRPVGHRFETRFHRRSFVYVNLVDAESDFRCQTSSWCGILKSGRSNKCRPRHLSKVQNYEVHHKVVLVLLLSGTFI
ncbi:hypothetical protein AVEN_210857-1 [Araneus ventricosus]|uniref:Uncharacterized protein n=1 Tax=Araneus ventricosus TaxID=182803 RepID=A0A4Y2CQJ7_ARAVE|nr:hypothetical protein AVEN_210857-1 [Araneus ventricosus]